MEIESRIKVTRRDVGMGSYRLICTEFLFGMMNISGVGWW